MLPGRGRLPAYGLPVGGLDVFEVLGGRRIVHLFHNAIKDDQRVSASANKLASVAIRTNMYILL